MYRHTKANLPHLNQAYESDFDNHPIYKRIGGWVCDKDTGELKYKLDKNNWNFKENGEPSVLTGEDGDVMVTIPPYFYKIDSATKTFEIDSIIPNENGDNGRPGFSVHPAFLTKNNKVKPYILSGAYKGSIIANQLRSVSGVLPAHTNTIAWFTDRARQGRNTGSNWHDITRFYERQAITLLLLFEFGTLNSQEAVGLGAVNLSSAIQTGSSNELGDRSGYLGENGKTSIRYRGIEDYWGNIWEFVTGFMITDRGYHYTNDPSKFLNLSAMSLYEKDLSVKIPDGYITGIEMLPSNEWMMIPNKTGGNTNTYFCDYLYTHNSGQENITLIGGRWNAGAHAGAFYFGCNSSASLSLRTVVARLVCSKEVV